MEGINNNRILGLCRIVCHLNHRRALVQPPQTSMLYCFFVISICLIFNAVAVHQEGWKMTDRFIGFRYEVYGNVKDTGIREEIKEKADKLACFGWAQYSPHNTVVGEVRCNKNAGKVMKGWIKAMTSKVDLKEYDDTKIKLHFSHFKIISDGRETCFRDEPHRCDQFKEK
mmetsp:Transcript_2926/g.4201  ORF Transcript_2926/g.4201 Transcript_2926/m.4201 type:complete len:170 (-) Transcript_2926:2028-2537(-)